MTFFSQNKLSICIQEDGNREPLEALRGSGPGATQKKQIPGHLPAQEKRANFLGMTAGWLPELLGEIPRPPMEGSLARDFFS
jgi:hypothetical protein